MTDKWYDKTVNQVEKTLRTNILTGLDRTAAKARLKNNGRNRIYPTQRASFVSYLKHMLTDYMSLLLLATIIIAAIFEEKTGTLVMAVILAVYYAFLILSYVRAQRVLEGMGSYGLPNVKVLRGGKLYIINQEMLAVGDVILLSAGDIVPADARLVETKNFDVLETSITSVPHAQRKNHEFIDYHDIAPAQQLNMIFASTIVTGGSAKAIVCETGEDTLCCIMKKNTSPVSNERLAIFDVMGDFCKKWTLFMSAAVIVLTALNLFISSAESGKLADVFLTGLSLAVSSMSEFYTAFVYIVLACGIFNAARHYKYIYTGALIKNSSKLEDIKDITCLVVPRKEAFSTRDMHVERVYTDGEEYYIHDKTFARHSSRVLMYALLSTGMYGGNRFIVRGENGNIVTPEENTIISLCEKCNINGEKLASRYQFAEHIAKSETNRFDTTLVKFENTHIVAVRGDYKNVLASCRYYSEGGKVIELTPEKRNELFITAALMAKASLNVVAVASKDTIYNNLHKLIACQSDMTFEGFIAIREPMLEGVAKNVSRCLAAGIKIIMLCDDSSEFNRYYAQTLGIIQNENQVIDSKTLSKMKEGLFYSNIGNYRVYEGLSTSQKYAVVKSLHDSGEKVGFLGCDLNDILLIKTADVGFAQSMNISSRAGATGVDITGRREYTTDRKSGGAAGCESLKFVSDVIISEPDRKGGGGFNAIVDSILCSRVIFMNLSRMVRYMVISQCARFFLVLFSVITGVTLLSPVQILFCGLIVDFLSVIAIAFEKPSHDMLYLDAVSSKRLLSPLKSNIPSVLLGVIWSAIAYYIPLFLKQYGIIQTSTEASTCVFMLFVITQIFILMESKKEKSLFIPNVRLNRMFVVMVISIAAFLLLAFLIPPLSALFNITAVSPLAWCGILITPVSLLIIYEVYKLITKAR